MPASAPNPADITDSGQPKPRLRFELILGSVLLAAGLFALPAAIYFVGNALLGPYGDKAGLGTFYADFFGDLAAASGRAWTLALGPLVLISWLRLLFLKRKAEPVDKDQPPSPPPARIRPATEAAGRRVEPRVSLDP